MTMTSKILRLVRPPQAVAEVAEIDPTNLQQEFASFSVDYMKWTWNLAAAQGRVAQAKLELDEATITARGDVAMRVEAEVEEGYRVKGRGQGPGGTTVDVFESIVQGEATIREGRATLIEAEEDEARIKAVCDTLRQKAQMLTNLGLHDRVSRQAHPLGG